MSRQDARRLLRNDRAARAAGMRIIAAGSDASDAPGDYLAAGADVVLHGEALGALSAIVCRLNGDAGSAQRRARRRPSRCQSRDARRAQTLAWPRRRCRNHRSRPCPRGISSTSKNTGASGGVRTAISVSTWPHRAAARSAATGARSPSGATSICNARPPPWPRRCCTSSATIDPTTSGSPTTSLASRPTGCASSPPRSRLPVAACPSPFNCAPTS